MADNSINNEGFEVKKAGCWPSPGCHNKCGILVSVEDGQIVKLKGNTKHPVSQGCGDRLPHLKKWLYHPDQLMYPLKRIGSRGENKWEKISWDQAMGEIGDKLTKLKNEYGAETLALTEGTYRSDMYGIRSRFLNLFGNPGNIGCAGTVCMCNRAAMGFALMGAPIAIPNYALASCVVISGWNVTESRDVEWRNIKKPDQNGKKKKIIVIDPRETEAAKIADIWLQLRPGTDTALILSWINVIIEEKLYDEAFVKEWTFGFDKLKERASEYTPEKVSGITWVPADKIRAAARMYATNKPTAFTYGMSTDAIGLNSMRAEQARVCLRTITGNMSVDGLETVTGPGPIINGKMAVRDTMLQLEDKCPPEQRKKQLGSDRFKLMTWAAYEITNKYYQEVYGIPQCMSGHNFLAHQPTVWQAILEGKPYPVKAMITWTSNPLLNAAHAKRVYQALKSPNLELHVVHEHFMTPTALLADYVLPAASKFEQPLCSTFEDFAPIFICGERAIQPLGERKTNYEFFRGLAQSLGFGEYFPWETDEDLARYRLAPLGISFEDASTEMYVVNSEPWTYQTINPKTGKPTGFATSTKKIELYSNVLQKLGYDPLPFYEEPPESPVRTPEIAKDFPFILITGGKFRPQFHSENRQFGMGMRELHPDPLMDINVDTANDLGICDGDWVNLETRRGVIKQRARLTSGIHPKVVNAESHWWFPEQPAEEPSLHGLWESNVNVLTTDDLDGCDPLNGGWPTRALLCKVYKVSSSVIEQNKGKRQ